MVLIRGQEVPLSLTEPGARLRGDMVSQEQQQEPASSSSSSPSPSSRPAAPRQRTPPPYQPPRLPSFSEHYNLQRAKADVTAYWFYLGICAASVWRLHSGLSAGQGAALLALTAVGVALLAWSSAAPASYARHRELAIVALRLPCFVVTAFVTQEVTVYLMETGVRWQQWGQGLGGYLRFLALLCFASQVSVLLLHSLVFRLPLGLHLMVQAICTALTVVRAEALCSCSVMRQPPSRAALRAIRVAFDGLSAAALHPPPPLPGGGAAGGVALAAGGAANGTALAAAEGLPECWAVMAMLEIFLGLVAPTVVLSVWECAQFKGFQRAQRGRYRRGSAFTRLYENTSPGVLGGGGWDWLAAAKLGLGGLGLFAAVWGGIGTYAARRAYAPLA